MKMMNTKRSIFCCILLCLCITWASAQQRRTITGTVKDDQGVAIPLASYKVKGTTKGGVTTENGTFSISVENTDKILVFSSIGFVAKEVSIGTSNTINVVLETDSKALGEVVVTALGIKREKKSLGYAVQEVKGESLVEARETNLANTLTGKVAGAQIIRSSNGPAGSSKIVLRGNNSLTGDNQPLIVVDGVPLQNFTGASNNDFWNPSTDMGNGLSDISAEDIESMSVLKGPSAAALYGSRAGNGVILITTKSGKAQKGLGINVSSSLGIETLFTSPEQQSVFGQGYDNIFNNRLRTSWGPKIEGQSVENWDGKSVPLTAYNNIDNYLGQGVNQNYSVSLQQQFNNTSIYTSFNQLEDKSMMPGVKYSRTNLTARATTKFGKSERWSTDTKIQYINSDAKNRPIGGNRTDNPFFVTYLHPRSLDIREFSDAVDANGNMFWYGESGPLNPYWASQYNQNQDVRNRFLMNGALKYEFTSWLNAEIKAGADMYTTNTESKLHGGSPLTATGRYSLGKQTFQEMNYSTLITATKDNLFGKLGGTATLGGNLMSQKFSGISSSAGELNARDLFSLNNAKGNPTVGEDFYQKKINSVYGSVGVNWDGYLFLDGTFRNDWSSALSKDNRSFFYPSVNFAYVFTDMMDKLGKNLPTWFSYAKLRASYATVGNDLGPYQLYDTYNIGKDPNGNTTAGKNGTLYDPNVKSELIKSLEIGTEMRFFNGRFGFDVAYYKSNATNQLLNIPLDPLSGYNNKKINAGDIQNEGIEAMFDARILTDPNSLGWNFSVNFSRNNNVINRLIDGVTTYPLGGYDDVRILAVTGEKYGDIYGSKFLRVKDAASPYFGQIILNGNGLPQRDPEIVKLGNQQATGLLGVTNSFNYKGIGFSFLVDARFGGKMFSATNVNMQRAGTAAATVVNGARENFVAEGVVQTSTGAFEPNTKAVSPQLYWEAIGVNNLGITEANLYDASSVRVRNVQLNYTLPAKFLANTPVQRAKIGFSCNNVWLIKSHLNGVDPESVYATGTNAVGFENASAPTTRTYLFNLTVGF